MEYGKKFGPAVSSLFLLGITLLGSIIFYVANSAEGLIENSGGAAAGFTNGWIGARLDTNAGPIDIVFLTGMATTTIRNFVTLADRGFYNGTKFHRAVKDVLIQGGDPLSKGGDADKYGTGGPGYRFKDEINGEPIVRGVVAMANNGPNKNGSQFFIVLADELSYLYGKHTVFAKVFKGMEAADAISEVSTNAKNVPIEPVVLDRVSLR